MRNKVLIISIIVLLLISGTGITAAYWKMALNPQNPNNVPPISDDLPSYGSAGEQDFQIRKNFIGIPPGGTMDNEVMVVPRDSSIKYQIEFKGKLDQNPDRAKVDVMLLIDRSMSMKSEVPRGNLPNDCIFTPNKDYDNSKLCWSIEAAQSFLQLTAEERKEIKVGYVTYGAENYTRDENNQQYFKPLADMWDPDQYQQTKKWLRQINFHSDDVSGTAMGKATNFALDELQEKGRPDVQKYIIVITDGIGNLNPLMTGCASWRRTPSDDRPSDQICRACPWGGGYRGDPNLCFNPPKPDPTQPSSDLNFLPPYRTPLHSADLVDCCINSTENAKVFEGYPPFKEIKATSLDDSPVGKAIRRNIKMPMIGFGIADSTARIGQGNLNDTLLRYIAEKTYKDPEAAGKWAFIVEEPAEIKEKLKAIFEEFNDKPAPIHFEETLPAGVEADISKITIERNVKNLEKCSEDNNYYCRLSYTINDGANEKNNINVKKDDNSGRVVLSFDLVPSHYSGDLGGTISFENRKFFVTLTVNSANAQDSAFDLDQNQDSTCDGSLPDSPENNPVSWVEWKWYPWPSEPSRNPIKTKTPKLCVRLRPTQYTGDVYGTGISNYLFPGIDVLVARDRDGIVPLGNTQAVWELPNYQFSKTSFSNFDKYQKYINGQIEDLKKKAFGRGGNLSISSALNSGVDEGNYPEGKIFYVSGNQTLNDPATMNGRRTVIVDGDLTINANISKAGKIRDKSTAAIIVLGNVSINSASSAGLSIEAGIIASGKNEQGVITGGKITIGNTSNYLDILGFLIGNSVQLKGLGKAATQSINYDINLAKFPPPGVASLDLPLYQEVAP